MEWTVQELQVLQDAVFKRYREFRVEKSTDPKNLSELWNRHVIQVGITGIRPKGKSPRHKLLAASDIIEVINFRNSEVSDALCIMNPDRPGQFLLVPREKASVIVMLGMP